MTDRTGTAPGTLEGLFCRAMLLLYPRSFRRRFGSDLLDDYERMATPVRHSGLRARITVWLRLLRDVATSVAREHARQFRRSDGFGGSFLGLPDEFRSAWRNLRAAPGLAALVVLTLALGMGPTTAVSGAM